MIRSIQKILKKKMIKKVMINKQMMKLKMKIDQLDKLNKENNH